MPVLHESLTRRELLLASAVLPAAFGAASAEWNRLTPLGSSALKVTRLGVGLERDTCEPRLIGRAVELGINHFNYFPLQGYSGAFAKLGAALKPWRDRVVLASCPYRGSMGRSAAEMEEDLDFQLKELKLDCIDLWYMTSAQAPDRLNDDLLNFMQRARKSGKIRASAVSTHNFAAIADRLIEVRGTIDAVMVVCNFATWSDAQPKTEKLSASLPGSGRDRIIQVHDAGIGVVAMKPLMGGLEFVPPDRKEWAKSVGGEERRNAALTAALKWVLQNRHIDTAPVRITGLDQLERNAKAASEGLDPAEMKLLAAEVERVSPYYCRMCRQCEGSCRQGLPVSDVIRFVMYADGYKDLDRARLSFRELPPRLQMVRCSECAECTVRCPNGVRVRERISRGQMILS